MRVVTSNAGAWAAARSLKRAVQRLWVKVGSGIAMLAIAVPAIAGPPPVVGGPLLDLIAGMPPGSWAQASTNLFSSVWTPPDLRPLNLKSNPTPSKIILAWSGFAWDTRRGDLILYGGGHANYSGNDVYRWHSSSLTWERASLPSQITQIYSTAAYMAIDGADAAPESAHTYDNNIYLPIVDRFLTLGGGLYDTGGPYLRPDEVTPGATRTTGPYVFDPSRANGNEVGGTTGSHVQRVAPYANVVGGNMWQNRDLTKNRPSDPQPRAYLSGCTAYSEEGGDDVVYISAYGGGGTSLDLFRYQISDVADPTTDLMSKVGRFWNGTAGQTTCTYDPSRELLVRTGSNTIPFIFWDLTAAGPSNNDQRVGTNDSINAFIAWLNANSLQMANCGIDSDPGDGSYAIWCGGPEVWHLRAPATNVTAGWSITMDAAGGTIQPSVDYGTGILGKWKYIPGYDVFMGLQDPVAGNIWIYKPWTWTAPQMDGSVNFAPQTALTSPADGTRIDLGTPISLSATATDSDGSIDHVDFDLIDSQGNTVVIGSVSSGPYQLAWTPSSAGTYALRSMAVDDLGGEGVSTIANVTVTPPDIPPTVAITSPANGTTLVLGGPAAPFSATAADADGTVASVTFFVNGVQVGVVTTPPYTVSWTPAQAGTYTLTARATDNQAVTTDSSPVTVNVTADIPPTVSLTSPADGSSSTLGTAVSVSANAGDSDGSVAKVEFFANGTSVGAVTSAPYIASWTPPATGTYSIIARATDNLGATTDSPSVSISVTPGAGAPATVTLQQGLNGYAGAADVMLSSYAPGTNFGGAPSLSYFRTRYTNLFRFSIFASDGGPVPDNSVVSSAILQIYKTTYNYVFTVNPMLKPWSATQATWNVSSVGNPWTLPGAQGAGSDYSGTPDAQFSAPWNAGWMTFDVTARVQAIGQGGANYGWQLVGVSGYNGLISFYSSEYATTTLRPQLIVTYSAPGP